MKKSIVLVFPVLLLCASSCPNVSISGKVSVPVVAATEYSANQLYSDLDEKFQSLIDDKTIKSFRLIRHLVDDVERPLIHVSGTFSHKLSSEDMGFDTDGIKPTYSLTFPTANDATLRVSTTDPNATSITISYPVDDDFSFGTFKSGIVQSGRIVFPQDDIDLSQATVKLMCAGEVTQVLPLENDGDGWYCSLNDKNLYEGTMVRLSGTVSFPPGSLVLDDGFYVLELTAHLDSTIFSTAAIAPGVGRIDPLPLFDFSENPWMYHARFRKIGLRFRLSDPVEGLVYRVQIPALDFDQTVKTGEDSQLVELSDSNKTLNARDEWGTLLLPYPYKLSAEITISPGDISEPGDKGAELIFHNVAPGDQINIAAVPEIIFDIEEAKLNLHGMLALRPADYPYGKIPNDNVGIDINDFLEPYDKYLKAENVEFNDIKAALFVGDLSPEGLLSETRVKLQPLSFSGYLNEDRDNNNYTTLNPGDVPPAIPEGETAYTGVFPQGILPLDIAKIQEIFRARPTALFVNYDARLPNKPVTVQFAEETTLEIPYELFVEIPLDLKLFADSPPEISEPYATIHFDNMAGENDIFGRKNAQDTITNGINGMDLETATLMVNYDNNLGYDGLEAYLVSKNGTVENFRRLLGSLNDGKGSFSMELDTRTIPWPFVSGVEIHLPATEIENGKKYAPFRIRRGGGITVEVKIVADGSVEFAGN